MAAERRLAGIQQHLCVVMTRSRAHSAAEAEPDIDAIVPLAPRPHTAADDLPGSAELGLSREEIEHFKTAGFVRAHARAVRWPGNPSSLHLILISDTRVAWGRW